MTGKGIASIALAAGAVFGAYMVAAGMEANRRIAAMQELNGQLDHDIGRADQLLAKIDRLQRHPGDGPDRPQPVLSLP